MEISWGCHGTFMEYKMGCKMGCTIWVKWCKIGSFQFPACKRLPEGSYFFPSCGEVSLLQSQQVIFCSRVTPYFLGAGSMLCETYVIYVPLGMDDQQRVVGSRWPAACHLLPYVEKKHSQSSAICFCCQCLSIELSNWLIKYTDHTSNSSGYLWFVISYPNWLPKKMPSWTRARLVTHSPHVAEQCCWDEQLRFSMPNVGPPVMWTLVYNPQEL